MGRVVRIISERRMSDASIRYEIDRSITGTAHEFYGLSTPRSTDSERPSDVLAERLLSTGSVESVHIFSNLVTVRQSSPSEFNELVYRKIVEDLFVHYHPGVTPTAVDIGADA